MVRPLQAAGNFSRSFARMYGSTASGRSRQHGTASSWLAANWRQGWTRASLTAGIAGGGTIRTTGYAFDIGRRDVAVAGDRLALRMMTLWEELESIQGPMVDSTLTGSGDVGDDEVTARRQALVTRGRSRMDRTKPPDS